MTHDASPEHPTPSTMTEAIYGRGLTSHQDELRAWHSDGIIDERHRLIEWLSERASALEAGGDREGAVECQAIAATLAVGLASVIRAAIDRRTSKPTPDVHIRQEALAAILSRMPTEDLRTWAVVVRPYHDARIPAEHMRDHFIPAIRSEVIAFRDRCPNKERIAMCREALDALGLLWAIL